MIENILAKFVAYYKGLKVKLDRNPRTGICEACGRDGRTQRHHFRYPYSKEQVKKNPELVLRHTAELCWACHALADVLRKWYKKKGEERAVEIVRKIFELMRRAENE